MEFLLTFLLVLLVYLTAVVMISGILALFSLRKGRKQAKRRFAEVFWNFFGELLNPFNWL